VDFVAERDGEIAYLQVAYLLPEPATVERELRPLRAISDHHPKLVLSLDPLPVTSNDGIRHLDLVTFLGGEKLGGGALG